MYVESTYQVTIIKLKPPDAYNVTPFLSHTVITNRTTTHQSTNLILFRRSGDEAVEGDDLTIHLLELLDASGFLEIEQGLYPLGCPRSLAHSP